MKKVLLLGVGVATAVGIFLNGARVLHATVPPADFIVRMWASKKKDVTILRWVGRAKFLESWAGVPEVRWMALATSTHLTLGLVNSSGKTLLSKEYPWSKVPLGFRMVLEPGEVTHLGNLSKVGISVGTDTAEKFGSLGIDLVRRDGWTGWAIGRFSDRAPGSVSNGAPSSVINGAPSSPDQNRLIIEKDNFFPRELSYFDAGTQSPTTFEWSQYRFFNEAPYPRQIFVRWEKTKAVQLDVTSAEIFSDEKHSKLLTLRLRNELAESKAGGSGDQYASAFHKFVEFFEAVHE